MRKVSLKASEGFEPLGPKRVLVHDSPYFKILNFNFKPGQGLPVHSHEVDGQLSIQVLEGEGDFLAKDGATLPAAAGDILIAEIAEPHGVMARTPMRILVTIAPPI
jgi:quercetin dioxygenase-like cupin family protein